MGLIEKKFRATGEHDIAASELVGPTELNSTQMPVVEKRRLYEPAQDLYDAAV